MKQYILELEQEARAWLVDIAAPIWSDRGRTASGLFPERMTLDGVPNDEYFRTFVQARHIYSMVAAGKAGWNGPWRRLADETMRVLIAKAKRPDGFYAHRLNRDAEVLDARADLYDQAFVLFALGTAGDALAENAFFDEAEALLDRIEMHWSHPQGGFREGEIVDPSVRRQNPHMHLFEAFTVLYEASQRPRFGDAARAVAELCRTKLVDPASGALLEYFKEDWTPMPGDEGRLVEPGHCFEWAWLFERLARSGSQHAVAVSDAMTAFGRRYGIDAQRGVAINEVLTNGRVVNGRARLWPQTERIKVAVLRYHRTGSEEDLQEVADGWAGLRRYFLPEAQHLWRDKMNEDGSFIEELVPGSSLYHISCAISEMCSLRIVEGT